MLSKKVIILWLVSIISVAIAVWVFMLPQETRQWTPPATVQGSSEVTDLGITYIPINPESSQCFDLGVDSGVLVTEVASGSPMGQASVQAGDVILSYNGTELDDEVSLVRLMRESPPDEEIVLEVCRENCCFSVECCKGCGTPDCVCPHSAPEE